MEKKDIEIPFGAFDSELGGFEYTIPEGYKAEIKDGKVVVRKTESEDERIRKSLIDMLKNDEKCYLKEIAWLEKQGEKDEEIIILKDKIESLEAARIAIQELHKPAEWSDEDEKMLVEIVKDLQVCKSRDISRAAKDAYQNEIDWLKSLKDRVRPQSTWKPSDEQMKALNYVVNLMASSESSKENDYYYNVFKDLKEQLKQL